MTKTSHKKITVLIPCFNEESGIAEVIKKFPREKLESLNYFLDIVVIDNNSIDRTAEIATTHGATVIHEPKKGKGNAIQAGFKYIKHDTDYVVMIDGDNTYRPEEILNLIEPLKSNFCDVVIGSRLLGSISEGSMTKFNMMGNKVFSLLVRTFYKGGKNVTDVLTGYFAWKRGTIERLRTHLISQEFTIEMEMVTKMAKLGEKMVFVPIGYDPRAGQTNLRPIRDGLYILGMFLQNLFWKPKNNIMSNTNMATRNSNQSADELFNTLSVVIPALNEEMGIASVIKQIPVERLRALGYTTEILVVDNASTDKTAEIAAKNGARVISQPIRGYGNAYQAGFDHATGDIIATGDADMTYPFDMLPELLATLKHKKLDFITTDRLTKLNPAAMTYSHVFGNWLLTFVTRTLFAWPFQDSQSGMWVFKRKIWKYLDVKSAGMPFSQELKVDAYVKGFKCGEEIIEYRPRIGEVKLNTVSDGIKNMLHLFRKKLSYSKKTPINAFQKKSNYIN